MARDRNMGNTTAQAARAPMPPPPHAAPVPIEPGPPPTPGTRTWLARLRPFLRVPLFYKILLANATIVALGAAAGTVVTASVWAAPAATFRLVAALGLAGILLSIAANAVILRIALSPLRELEEVASRVQAGELEARAPRSPVADRDLERLTATFNAMLESLSTYRRRLREMAARNLDAAEEERKRLARELHDDTAQTLAALLLRLRLARHTTDATARDRLLDEVREEIANALDRVRRFARGLRPPALDMLGLDAALEAHARSLQEASGLRIEVESTRIAGLLAPEAELALYRIVQEALANVLRHARARRARVRLARSGSHVIATVEDDGVGFDPARAFAEGGLGLFGMRERAAYIGGQVEIDSRPGQGTRITARIPIPENTAHAL